MRLEPNRIRVPQQFDRFGDFFHEIPDPEIFTLPCGGSVSSECVINSLGQTWTVEVIPRQLILDRLNGTCPDHSIALGFRVVEHAGLGQATIYMEPSGVLEQDSLGVISADSLPAVKQTKP